MVTIDTARHPALPQGYTQKTVRGDRWRRSSVKRRRLCFVSSIETSETFWREIDSTRLGSSSSFFFFFFSNRFPGYASNNSKRQRSFDYVLEKSEERVRKRGGNLITKDLANLATRISCLFSFSRGLERGHRSKYWPARVQKGVNNTLPLQDGPRNTEEFSTAGWI